jgi:anti-sigma regulatory factor (Ser/Thr protein kinase)
MTDDRVEDLTLCASEAATNALKHAGGGRVSLDYEGETVRVRVADQGSGIDQLQLPRATLLKGYSTRASMGLGFTLMHELADRLYLNTGPHGTTVILEMALQRRSEAEKMLALLNLAD